MIVDTLEKARVQCIIMLDTSVVASGKMTRWSDVVSTNGLMVMSMM